MRRAFKTNRFYAAALTLSLLGAAHSAPPTDSDYRRQTEKWRADYEASIKADDGWLTVAGLFWLKEGVNRFGTDPSNDIVLPKDSTAPGAGAFHFRAGKTHLEIEKGVEAFLNGKAISSAEIRSDEGHKPDLVSIGGLTLVVIKRGDRYGVRVRNKLSR